MAISWALWDRSTLLVVVTILGISSGVASFAPEAIDGVTGHTSYVSGVVFIDAPEPAPEPAVTYGLATYRDIRFFGLWNVERIVPPSQDRMVFVWSADAPDPRDHAPTPTGAYAMVRDRLGVEWDVYEFTYDADGHRHHTYGTRVGEVRHVADPSIGTHGDYNHVLVYRADRLLAPAPLAPAPLAPAPPEQGVAGASSGSGAQEDPVRLPDARPAPTLEETIETVDQMRAPTAPEAPAKPRLAFGLGAPPPALDDPATDPATPAARVQKTA